MLEGLNDLEVVPVCQREDQVLRSEPRVDSAVVVGDAELFCQTASRGVQTVLLSGERNMVQIHTLSVAQISFSRDLGMPNFLASIAAGPLLI